MRANGENRNGGILDHLFSDGAEDDAVNALAAMGAHDNEVHVITLGLGENFIGSVADEHLAGSLDALEMLGNEGAPLTISPTKA